MRDRPLPPDDRAGDKRPQNARLCHLKRHTACRDHERQRPVASSCVGVVKAAESEPTARG